MYSHVMSVSSENRFVLAQEIEIANNLKCVLTVERSDNECHDFV